MCSVVPGMIKWLLSSEKFKIVVLLIISEACNHISLVMEGIAAGKYFQVKGRVP